MKKLMLFCAIALLVGSSTAQSIEPIEIDIPDLVTNGTTIKRKARLFTMTYNQQAGYVSLSWKVSFFADSAGCYGQLLTGPGIMPYTRESIANNTVLVKPATGEIVEPDSTGAYPAIPLIGQYDFFYNLAENENINVHDLIRAYGAAVKNW